MARYVPPPDEPDNVTHTPKEVDDMETPREKFDDWLRLYHWFVYAGIGLMLLVCAILSRC